MTRGCHPDSEYPQTDVDQKEEEGDGIASSLIVKISGEIWAQCPTDAKSYLDTAYEVEWKALAEKVPDLVPLLRKLTEY